MIKFNFRFYLCFLFVLLAWQETYADNIKVKGVVLSESTSDPIIGASVLVLGTNIGTTTNIKGEYELSAPADSKLEVSFIGYTTAEISVNGRVVVDVLLSEALNELDDVVVVGYGTMRKRDLTGANTTVNSETFSVANPNSIQSALMGRVAGVQITGNDNSPGAGFTVLVRGGGSITSGNTPLYVIDGMPIVDDGSLNTNPLSDINPSQIESIDIMKDASSSAIYGSAGANGVVLITTKKGIEGKPQISIDYSFGMSQITNIPDVLSVDEYVDYQINSANAWCTFNNASAVKGYSSLNYWTAIKESALDQGTNWLDAITQVGKTHNFGVTMSGGTKGLNYQVGTNYYNQEGVIVNSGYNRLSLNSNITQEINSRLKAGFMINVGLTEYTGMVNSWQQDAIITKAIQTNPFMGVTLSDLSDDAVDYDSEESWNNENIVEYLDMVDMSSKNSRIIANAHIQYKILPDLLFYTSYGINKSYTDSSQFLPSTTSAGAASGGYATLTKRNYDNYVLQSRLNYNKKIGDHNFGVMVAYEMKETNNYYFYQRVESFASEELGIYDLSTATVAYVPTNTLTSDSMMSGVGRVNYSYKGRYTFNASLRADGSSKFGENNKWGYFPAVAAAWLISEESFTKNISSLDLLKLRLSYGVTGNNQIDAYSSLATVGSVKYQYGGTNNQVGSTVTQVANPDLKWETTAQYNAGIDLGMFNNRIHFVFDAYYKLTTDLLLDVDIPSYTGFTSSTQNLGSVENKGLEFALNTVNISTDNFTWTSNLTLTFTRNKVLDIGKAERYFTRNFNSSFDDDVLLREGMPIGIYYGYVTDGVQNNDTELANSPVNSVLTSIVGQQKYVDIDGDGQITINDKVPIANTNPDFTGGWNNTFTYKNFDLNIMLRFSYGNDVIAGNSTYLIDTYSGAWNTFSDLYKSAWTPANTDGSTVGFMASRTHNKYLSSDWVEDGSYLKCGNITLGYTFQSLGLKAKGIGSLRAYATVTNPFIISSYSWFDPEITSGSGTAAQVGPGADVGTYPLSTTYTFGLSLKI
ncbi:MAG: TonB-dependent receptor [Rikenellaceae bacterium]